MAGQLDGPSSYLMKSPYTQRPDDEAREATEEFIERHARTHEAGRRAREARGGGVAVVRAHGLKRRRLAPRAPERVRGAAGVA